MRRRPPSSTLFPYTTLFRSLAGSAACGKNPGAGAPVPQSMNESVAQFFTAVKGNDLTRMGQLWGTERGPAADNMNPAVLQDRKSTRLNSSHTVISYAVFCLK